MSAPHPTPPVTGASRPPPAAATRRARPIYRVFVSSTWLDLQPERRALMDALNRMEEMRFVGMEFFGNRPDDTHDASIDQVDLCELFVGVIGFRYGSGITEAEYRRARQLELPCFIYLKREAASSPELTDNDPALAAKLASMKADLMRSHTVKEFTGAEELAANATADLHNWVAARWITLEPSVPPIETRAPVAAPDADRTNSLRLLERIEHDWIRGVLDASLHRRAWLDLGLDWRDEAVEQPWDRILVAPDRPVQTLGERDTIAGVFAAAQNTLLVLGEPGAGKTTTLLELARNLVRGARESAGAPLPVVLALSTWTVRHKTLRDWLIEELNLRYQVPKRLAIAWLDAGRLTLLLDGLDEVREDLRAACVAAINAFAHEHAPAGLAVTCRVGEYSGLRERLQLRSAICLQPLTAAQIDAYFHRAGAGLENLRRAMREDEALRELAQTPLMLSVMTMAWRDAPEESLRGDGITTVAPRRAQLLDAYVQSALRRKAGGAEAFPRERTLGWLAWLAREMKKRGQTLFALEQLQPGWLGGGTGQLGYFAVTRIVATFVLGLPFWLVRVPVAVKVEFMLAGLAAGLGFAAIDLIFARRARSNPNEQGHRCLALVAFLTVGSATVFPLLKTYADFSPPGAFTGCLVLYFALIAFLLVSLSADVKERDISSADAIGWSWRRAVRPSGLAICLWQEVMAIGFVGTFMTRGWSATLREFSLNGPGLLVGCGAGAAAAGMLLWRHGWRGIKAVAATFALVAVGGEVGDVCGAGFKGGLGFPLVSTVIVGLLTGLPGGLTAALDTARARRSGGWFWLKVPMAAALAMGTAVGLVIGMILVVLKGRSLMQDWLVVAPVVAAICCTFGLVTFLKFGGLNGLQHYVLRRLLVGQERLPANTGEFLDHAAKLNLLQRVGFGYRFIHALLLEHLAEKTPDPARQRKPPPDP